MEIGGIDVTLSVESDVVAAEVILDAVREIWPNAVFEDGIEVGTYSIDDPEVGRYWAAGPEFFVYRDCSAADAWERLGGVDENQDSMLHFLLATDAAGNTREVTVVIGSRTAEMERLLRNLKENFDHPAHARLEAMVA